MPISGYVAAGAQDALDQVLQRRLQEETRRAVEQQRQEELQLRREALEQQQQQQQALVAERAEDRALRADDRAANIGAGVAEQVGFGDITAGQRDLIAKNPVHAARIREYQRPIIDARPIPGVGPSRLEEEGGPTMDTGPLDKSGPQSLPIIELSPTQAQQKQQTLEDNRRVYHDRLVRAGNEGQRRAIGTEAGGYGVDIDKSLLGPTSEETLRQTLATEDRADKRWREHQSISTADTRETQRLDDDRTTARAKAAKGVGTLSYARELNTRVTAAAHNLTDRVSPWTTGRGSLLSFLPETAAADFEADLDTLKSNIAFGALAAMRAASPTGGALGAVSERELALLESTLGALSTRQSPANFKRNLQNVIDSIERWNKTVGQADAGSPFAGAGGGDDDDLKEIARRRAAQGQKK